MLLVVAISFAIPMSSAYVCYYTVAAADFISHDLKLETFDQVYLLAATQSQLEVSRLGGFFNGIQQVTYLFGQCFHLFPQILSLNQINLTLRC